MTSHRIRRRVTAFESCEPRICLTAVAFGSENNILDFISEPSYKVVADLDGDSDPDLLIGFVLPYSQFNLGWYENSDGKGTFSRLRSIAVDTAFQTYNAPTVLAVDMDGDVDLDIVTMTTGHDGEHRIHVAWYENQDGRGNFGSQRVIVNEVLGFLLSFNNSLSFADTDGDGDADLVVTGNGGAWYEHTDGKGTFGPRRQITERADYIVPADLDGDRDLDMIVWSMNFDPSSSEIGWYENTDGKGAYLFRQTIVKLSFDSSPYFRAVDIDGDLDSDVFLRSGIWYENADGKGKFGDRRTITDGNTIVDLEDLDQDGDLDVISSGKSVEWRENLDSKGSLGEPRLILSSDGPRSYYPSSVMLADMDSDGDKDVVSLRIYNSFPGQDAIPASYVWANNRDGKGTFSHENYIPTYRIEKLIDVDLDGDLDVVSSSGSNYGFGSMILWHSNANGKGSFRQEQVIAIGIIGSIQGVDMDADQDPDLLFGYYYRFAFGSGFGQLGWYELSNGATDKERPNVIVGYGNAIAAPDIDGDGDLDVLAASSFEFGLGFAWTMFVYEKVSIGYAPPVSVDGGGGEVIASIGAADIDGDGDRDIVASLVGSEFSFPPKDAAIIWYENRGRLEFGPQQVIVSGPTVGHGVSIADIDNDGDIDLVTKPKDKVTWYPNLNGKGTFGPEQVLVDQVDGFVPVSFADIDGDRDIDLLVGKGWYENVDGKGNFQHPRLISTDANIFAAGDMDRDGDVDILASNPLKVTWHENLGIPGDANHDGRFDSSDLVLIFQAGEYEDSIARNSTKAEGDFNGDDEFDSSDLVFAFQEGSFTSEATRLRKIKRPTLTNIAVEVNDSSSPRRANSSLL